MKCIGITKIDGVSYLCFCACIMRQIAGCNMEGMKTGKNVRKNFDGIIEKIDWDKITICYSETGNDYNEPCVCCCLGGQKDKSCDSQMNIMQMSREKFMQKIDAMIC